MKFKIGDKVKYIGETRANFPRNSIGTITDFEPNYQVVVTFESGYILATTHFYVLELISSTITPKEKHEENRSIWDTLAE